MGRIDQIRKEMEEIEVRRKDLWEEYKRLMGTDLSERMKALFPNDEITLEGIFQVDWDELGNRGYGDQWWKKITAWLDEQQHGKFNPDTSQNEGPMPLRGVYRDGYNPNTNQVAFKVMMRQQLPVEDQLGLLLVLPLTKAHEGWKRFSIFEESCGEHGQFYSLTVSEDHQVAEVWNNSDLRYSREYGHKGPKPMFTAKGKKAVEEALEFIRQRVPYERAKSDEDEDTDW